MFEGKSAVSLVFITMGRPPSGTRIQSILAKSDAPTVGDLEIFEVARRRT